MTTASDPITEYLRSQPLVVEVVEPEMAAVLRDKTEAERYSIALGLWHFARNTIRRQIAADHPDWTQDQVYREATRRLLHDS